jgi:DNA-binding NtrC family response regulator
MVSETMASTSASSSALSSDALSSGLTPLTDPTPPRLISALEQDPLRRLPAPVRHDPEDTHLSIHGLCGRSPAMHHLIQQIRRMAPHLTLATIEGEEGTGRTLAARALHAAGPEPDGPFVPCLATHFFSPAPSDATGSDQRHRWSAAILDAASGGMLFLDRVHQLSTEQQERLADFLHWIDDRHFHARQRPHCPWNAAGQHGLKPALPAQIVFSTSVSLRNPGHSGRFRDDLASRLCSVRFHLPPLAQRREDIPLLAQIFIQRVSRVYGKPVRGLGPGAIAPLLRYAWPGNVRELEQTITAAALETESQWIRPIDLPPLTASAHQTQPHAHCEAGAETDFNLDHAIRNHVARVLARTRGNKLRAAQLLGISRSTLYRILAEPPRDGYSSAREATVANEKGAP